MRGEPVTYLCLEQHRFSNCLEGKNAWKETTSARGVVSAQGKYYRNYLHETVKVYKTGKKRKSFLFFRMQPYGHCLLVTSNFSKRKWETYQVEIQI